MYVNWAAKNVFVYVNRENYEKRKQLLLINHHNGIDKLNN